MTESLTYVERADAQDKQADAERFTRIEKLFSQFEKHTGRFEYDFVKSANIGREIGLELQGIVGAEQMSFTYFQTHCAKSLPFDWTGVQRFIGIARKSPTEFKTIADAAPIMQQVMFAAHLLGPPEPRGPQATHDGTPVTFTFHTFGTAVERIKNRFRDLSKWDSQTRQGVWSELERAEKQIAELKQQLSTI